MVSLTAASFSIVAYFYHPHLSQAACWCCGMRKVLRKSEMILRSLCTQGSLEFSSKCTQATVPLVLLCV